MGRSLRIAIVGAGIGGLVVARALAARGFEMSLHDRAESLGEVGAGLQVGPSAVKVLDALGLGEGLRAVACAPDCFATLAHDDGRLRHREPYQETFARFGAPYFTAHRADLHALLADGVPPAAIHLGRRCTGLVQDANGAAALFADGSEVEADVVIGADGIRSAIRGALWGADRPRYTGYSGWRAVLPLETALAAMAPHLDAATAALHRRDVVMWRSPTGTALFYPLRAGELLNVFAGRFTDRWAAESWTVPSSREEMIAAFSGWHPALLAVLGALDEVFEWAFFDRDPLAAWTSGRATLLGDAAHPMMPTLAQGAAIAIEDGFALGRLLDRFRDDPAAGLAAYEGERLPRASRVQLMARRQFDDNRRDPPPPPQSRDWIFAHDVTCDPVAA